MEKQTEVIQAVHSTVSQECMADQQFLELEVSSKEMYTLAKSGITSSHMQQEEVLNKALASVSLSIYLSCQIQKIWCQVWDFSTRIKFSYWTWMTSSRSIFRIYILTEITGLFQLQEINGDKNSSMLTIKKASFIDF